MDFSKLKGKVQEALDKTDIDEKVKAGAEKLKGEINKAIS